MQEADQTAQELLKGVGVEPEDLDDAYAEAEADAYEAAPENSDYAEDAYDDGAYEDAGDGPYEEDGYYDDGYAEGPYEDDAYGDDPYYEDDYYEEEYYEEEKPKPVKKKKKHRKKHAKKEVREERRLIERDSREPKKKKSHLFLWCMLAYVAVAVIVSFVLYKKLWSYIADYEMSLPKYGMDPVMEALAPGGAGVRSLVTEDSFVPESRFTDYNTYISLLAEKIDGKECTYQEASGASAEHPRYVIIADGTPVLEVSLQAVGQNGHGMNLWGPESYYVREGLISGEDYEITVPSDATVTVNGITLTQEDLKKGEDGTPEKTEIKDLELVIPYLSEVPYFVTYEAKDVLGEISVSAVAADQSPLVLSEEDHHYTAALPTDDAAVAEISEKVNTIMESYGKHFIGKDGSGIYQYLLPDSEYRSSVRSVDVSWFPTSHITSFEFENQTATNFISYTPECVACDVGFDLMVYFDSAAYKTQNRGADGTWIFVKQDGTWYLAQVLRQTDRSLDPEED